MRGRSICPSHWWSLIKASTVNLWRCWRNDLLLVVLLITILLLLLGVAVVVNLLFYFCRYSNCFVTGSKSQRSTFVNFPVLSHTYLIPVFVICLRFKRLRCVTCLTVFILVWARPCGVKSTVGLRRCAAHRGEQGDAYTLSHM